MNELSRIKKINYTQINKSNTNYVKNYKNISFY